MRFLKNALRRLTTRVVPYYGPVRFYKDTTGCKALRFGVYGSRQFEVLGTGSSCTRKLG